MKMKPLSGSNKTNPIKPNFKCPQTHQRSEEKGIRNFFWLSVAGKDII